jgi:hypothetical protein
LAVTGTSFVPGSLIRWNGTDLPTTLNGGLIAHVPAGDIATAGTCGGHGFQSCTRRGCL